MTIGTCDICEAQNVELSRSELAGLETWSCSDGCSADAVDRIDAMLKQERIEAAKVKRGSTPCVIGYVSGSTEGKMDWAKVVKALDDEWDRHRQACELKTDPEVRRQHRALADIAFMLRDCLQCGLPPEDR